MYWVVATDLGDRSRIQDFINILKYKNQNLELVSLEQMLNPKYSPSFIKDENTFFYGPVNFVQRMSKFNQHPGVIGSHTFTLDNIFKNVPENYLLNNKHSTFIGTAEGIENFITHNAHDLYFFKPGNDQKLFTGGAYNVADIKKICWNIKNETLPDANKDMPLVIGELYGIEAEYRCFVINHTVATVSQYARHQEYYISNHIPEKVLNFAQKMIDIWSPEEGYVLDIGLSNGNPYIIEYQGINSAGFYASDLNNFVSACIELWK